MHQQAASGARPGGGFASRVLTWFDERTGIRQLAAQALQERIPGGARAAYVFGSGLLFIFLLQVITGISLALYYTPTAETAHTSVAYITKQVAGGAFLRSLHSYGSSAMIIVLGLHFLQTFFYGSFKGRRELLWLSGAFLSMLILGMGFTGYLLPWDQKAYFATAVGTNVAGEVPFIGSLITRMLRGGNSIGTLTLSRFYVAHVFLIPAMIFAFIGAHVLLFRKAGPAGPIEEHPVSPKLPTETFYPRQVLLDMGFALTIIAVLAGLSYLRPVTLGPIADPADSHFLPRPEWYYLPMFQWLKYWEGSWVVLGIVVIPGLVATLFFLMPFIDRRLERRPWRRPIPALAVTIVVAGMVFLGIKSQIDDHKEPVAAQLALQHEQEAAYTAAPFEPYVDSGAEPASGALSATVVDTRVSHGRELFVQRGCVGCHGDTGLGTSMAPSLQGVTRRFDQAHLIALLQSPNARMRAAGMPTVDVPSDEMAALVAYLAVVGTREANVPILLNASISSSPSSPAPGSMKPASIVSGDAARLPSNEHGNPAVAGKEVFQERACFACHGPAGTGGRAPALGPMVARMSDAELVHVLAEPNARMRAGGMPPVEASSTELQSLISYLRTLRAPRQLAPLTAEPPTKTADAVPAPPAATPEPAASKPAAIATASFEEPATSPAKAGKALFRSQGCVGCHGNNAEGTPIAPSLAGVSTKYPGDALVSLLRQPTRKMKAGGMPTPAVNDAQMSELVSYLRSLGETHAADQARGDQARGDQARAEQAPHAAPSAPEPAQDRQPNAKSIDAAVETHSATNTFDDPFIRRGQQLFQRSACGTCHGVNGLHGTVAAPGLAGTASLLSESTLDNLLQHHSARMQKGGMPLTNFKDRDRKALIAYIRSLPSDAASLELKK
jgi:ubiquinol-cytochrome c reductase cytochrome b subunit